MKILGYLAPHDMFEGKVKKGDLYVRSQSADPYYAFEAKKGILFYHLPAEIVTKWEAKFEETETLIWEGVWDCANETVVSTFITEMKKNFNITRK